MYKQMSKHIYNLRTGNVTKKFEVSTDSLHHTDFKFGLTFNFVMSQTKLAAQTSLFFTFGIRRNFFFFIMAPNRSNQKTKTLSFWGLKDPYKGLF